MEEVQKKLSQGAHFRIFWEAQMGPGGPFEDQGEPIWDRQLLSVSVVFSVSVWRAMECQMTC